MSFLSLKAFINASQNATVLCSAKRFVRARQVLKGVWEVKRGGSEIFVFFVSILSKVTYSALSAFFWRSQNNAWLNNKTNMMCAIICLVLILL